MREATARQETANPKFHDLRKQMRQESNGSGHDLIASDRVEGTDVYRPDGDKIGRIHHFMVGKRSGMVEHAVMSFGGFLGMGQEMRPVPWEALDYDVEKGGYILSVDEDTLRDSPSYESKDEPSWDRTYSSSVYGYWGVPY